ncbi:hypothetical protein MJO47_03235 [Desulfuromonas sp. KJ2020]|uniref:hypothetical protein n=1 Tax=Desulfuromonas sp. KJ2020 TaxID=2919173 RepID=UPI0020A6EE2D|nr:hypothetical protein [Desulfuromonas sp. KJ2020]MCP3176106.1 hypothetical protein [Desulfuromonas sp. KJ2020]
MKELLKAAIDSLEIQDVYVAGFYSWLKEDFDPKYSLEKDDLTVQYKHVVEKAVIAELRDEDEDNVMRLYKVFITLGARWVHGDLEEDDDSQDPTNPDEKIKALIEAHYILEYRMENEVEEGSLDAFALNNASYHVWPYWRELLMNHCLRMNMPKLALPTLQLASNRK